MNRVVKIVLAIAILIIVPKFIQRVAFGTPKDKALAALRETVKEVSPTLPKKIDAVTTLTKVEASGDTYRVYYTMDPSVPYEPSKKGAVEQNAKHLICGSEKKVLADNGINIEYLYTFSGPSGDEKMSVVVPAGSCT
jgi:hypothetical protein